MPRRIVPFMPHQYYHFYNRGNNRQAVFVERDNFLYFLRGIKKYLCPQVDVLAYCLMPTHYHILGRVKPSPQTSETSQTSEVFKTSEVLTGVSRAVSRAMQKFGISYTKAINKRYARVGALFQGQFQGKVVESYPYLTGLCIYIHANPVRDGLVRQPEDWEFSNYREWMGLRAGTLVNQEFISDTFGTPEEYRSLVQEYLQTWRLPEDVLRQMEELEG